MRSSIRFPSIPDEPYWKLDDEISTEPLVALRSTFCGMERDAMLRAAYDVVAFFRERATLVGRTNGLVYPEDLDTTSTIWTPTRGRIASCYAVVPRLRDGP